MNHNLVAGRYRSNGEIGKGAFAKVYRAVDTHTNKQVALKVLKTEFSRDAAREVRVLTAISRNDLDDRQKCCKMINNFNWAGQCCIIFSLHGSALRSRKFGNVDKSELAKFAKQMSAALDFLHYTCRIIHTDLKPENILIDSANAPPGGLGDSWRICDLGSASFYTERCDKELITTRPYRAPEVILGSGWGCPSDMFSLGVIIYEIYTGRTLFECTRYCDSDMQHLQQMEKRQGQFPSWMIQGAGYKAKSSFFDMNGRLRQSSGSGSQPINVPDTDLQDLILKLIHYDPVVRARADEVPHHNFISRYMGHCSEPIRNQMPPSAYSSGLIRTPGCATMRNRPSINRQLEQERVVENRGRSNSTRIGKDRVFGGILGDVTNRQALHQQPVKRYGLGLQQQPVRPRCGSAVAGLNRMAALPGQDYWDREAARPRQYDAWLYR